jgi:hypothetical protein
MLCLLFMKKAPASRGLLPAINGSALRAELGSLLNANSCSQFKPSSYACFLGRFLGWYVMLAFYEKSPALDARGF